jgi:hypothetical protein
MNAETLDALNEVRDARKKVLNGLTDNTVSQEEKKVLGDILINLQDQEDALINLTLQDMVDKINASNAALKDLIQQMNDASRDISRVSDTIKKISKVLSTLTVITSKAIGSGLLG